MRGINSLETQIAGSKSRTRVLTENLVQCQLLSDEDLAVGEVRDLLETETELRLDCDRQREREAGRNLRDIEVLGQPVGAPES